MSASYVPYQPDQQYLMPCALQEWLPQVHLAYFIKTQWSVWTVLSR